MITFSLKNITTCDNCAIIIFDQQFPVSIDVHLPNNASRNSIQ